MKRACQWKYLGIYGSRITLAAAHAPRGCCRKGLCYVCQLSFLEVWGQASTKVQATDGNTIPAELCSFLWPREKPEQAQMATTLEKKTNLIALEQNLRIHIQHSYAVCPQDSHSIPSSFCLFRFESKEEASGKICEIKYQAEHLQRSASNKHPRTCRACLAQGHLQNCPLFHLLKSVRATQELRAECIRWWWHQTIGSTTEGSAQSHLQGPVHYKHSSIKEGNWKKCIFCIFSSHFQASEQHNSI